MKTSTTLRVRPQVVWPFSPRPEGKPSIALVPDVEVGEREFFALLKRVRPDDRNDVLEQLRRATERCERRGAIRLVHSAE